MKRCWFSSAECRCAVGPDRVSEGVPRREGGFALIVVLLVLVGLTALATAGYLVTSSDHKVSQNYRADAHAFDAANAGLYEYLGTHTSATDTQVYTYGTSTVTVFGTQLLDLGNNRQLYRISASAAYQPPEGGVASRVLSTVAVHGLTTVSFTIPGAMTSGAGIHKNGNSGTISGFDAATPADCPGGGSSNVAGVAVPPGGWHGPNGLPQGNPNIDQSQAGLALLQATGINWNAMINGGSMSPTYTIPPDAWPNFAALGPNAQPLIYLTGSNFSVGPANSGRGVIVARHDLTITGSFNWDGILLVGGSLTSDGNQYVYGATVTGLNLLLGEPVSDTDVGNGTKTFQYDSCKTKKAAQSAFGKEILSEEPASLSEGI